MKRTTQRRSSGRVPLPAKLTRPQAQAIVPRARLFKRLEAVGGSRWCWIGAPAGAGKTTLASSWIEHSGLECLWASIDAGDADPATLFHYLGLVGKYKAGSRRVNLPLLGPEFLPRLDVFARRFFEQLFSVHARPFAVVLDNCHEVPCDAPFVQVVLGALIESLPERGCLVCLSRGSMPSTLRRLSGEPGFVGLGYEELSFTDEEAAALARLSAPHALAAVPACNRWVKGWVAGLKLLLRAPAEETARVISSGAVPRRELFEYFAEEVFKRLTLERRELLSRCAVLPEMDAQTVADLSGLPDAGSFLAELYAERLFIERRHLAGGLSYRLHPLFRDFLHAHLVREVGAAEVAALKACAACLLESREELEAATGIALECRDADLLTRLILRQAEALFMQGRMLTLAEWIGAVAEPVRSMNAWLLYWFGLSISVRDPARGRADLERAYQLFEERGETIGAWLTVAGIIHSLFIVWGADPEREAHWMAVFARLQAQHGGTIPGPIEAQVILLLGQFASHCPEHAVTRYLVARAQILAPRLDDPVQRCAIGSIAVGFLTWQGDERAARALIAALQRGRDEDEPITLGTMIFDIWRGILLWTGAEYERSFEVLAATRLRARSAGLRLYEWHCGIHMLLATIGMADLELAERTLEEVSESLASEQVNVAYASQVAQALYLARSGRPAAAIGVARAAQGANRISGEAPGVVAFAECMRGWALLESGLPAEADACARTVLDLAARLPSDRWVFEAEMLGAAIELDRGALDAVVERLRAALEIAARRNFSGGLALFASTRTARLLALALSTGIEVDQARRLIRSGRFAVPDDPQAAALWPVRLRIRLLGGFAVEVNEQPLTRSQRAARKPLEVLEALIGLGPAVGLEALQASLWPELEGDAARNACHVAIHRLRKLLGDERAIQVDKATVRLDMRDAWADVEAFRRASSRLQAGLATGIRSQEEARQHARELLRAYPGHFLPPDEQPWVVGVRERLRNRFMQVAIGLSAVLERLGATEEAIDLNRHGIDLDPYAEAFHRGLIRSLVAVDRRAEALQALQRCRDLLRVGLGVAPSPETERLMRRIRADR
jgi:LuxR family maltose regulon positive regulatory protein